MPDQTLPIIRNGLDYFEVPFIISQPSLVVGLPLYAWSSAPMKRLYHDIFKAHLQHHRQMIFVMGPRQSGKTTVAQRLVEEHPHGLYLNWDNMNDRDRIVQGPNAVAQSLPLDVLSLEKPLIVFDELHKFKQWRDFLKGFYDSYPHKCHIIVTGSAKLDVFNRGGDSLMGRYFPFHFHPLSVAELAQRSFHSTQEYWPQPQPLEEEAFDALWKFGGYPDPFLKRTDSFSRRWKTLRSQQLFSEDIRDLTRIQEIDKLELLATKLTQQVGALTSYQTLANQLRVSDNTIRNWLETLKILYYCFSIKPWSANITRALLKEPKYYLWDWSLCDHEGMRAENMMALHLLKAIHYWNDSGLGHYQLHFIRDKEKREVDFLVTKNHHPWLLLEVKLSHNQGISNALRYFHALLNPSFTFQAVFNLPYVSKSCFETHEIQIVPFKTLLSQLV